MNYRLIYLAEKIAVWYWISVSRQWNNLTVSVPGNIKLLESVWKCVAVIIRLMLMV